MWYHENQTCHGQKYKLNVLNLLEYIKNINFTSPTGNEVRFDDHGGIKPKYNIYNYQVQSSCQNCSKSFDIVNVWYTYWDGDVPINHLKFNTNANKIWAT